MCIIYPLTKPLAEALVQVGRVVMPGPGAGWLARGGLGVDQVLWYGIQLHQVGIVTGHAWLMHRSYVDMMRTVHNRKVAL
jgi:hypothetical protein